MNIGLQSALERLQDGLGDLRDQHAGRRSLADYRKYDNDPLAFFRDELLEKHTWPLQDEIALLVRDHPLVAVAGGNGVGKDFRAARIGLWLVSQGWLVLLTGPTQRQVIEIMMAEVARAFAVAPDFPGKLFQASLQIPGEPHAGIVAFTSTDASRVTGFHGPKVCIIVTESQAVEPFVFEAILSNAIGDHSRILLIGNPLFPSGKFYEAFQPGSNWKTLRLPSTAHPNYTSGENLIPGAVTRAGVERIAQEFGTASNMYRSRVMALFPEDSLESLIKRPWLDAAADKFESGHFDQPRPLLSDPLPARWQENFAAVDPARFGSDRTAMAVRQGPVLRHLLSWTAKDTMETCGLVQQQLTDLQVPLHTKKYVGTWPDHCFTWGITIDAVGLGAGVLDRLKEEGLPAMEFNGGHTPPDPRDAERFHNRRASSLWHLRTLLEAGKIALPRNAQLFDELVAHQWKVSSTGKIQIESKDDIRARLGRSPDLADAVVMAFEQFGTIPTFRQIPVRYGR